MIGSTDAELELGFLPERRHVLGVCSRRWRKRGPQRCGQHERWHNQHAGNVHPHCASTESPTCPSVCLHLCETGPIKLTAAPRKGKCGTRANNQGHLRLRWTPLFGE